MNVMVAVLRQLVRALGMMIFSALDYGLGESEEQKLSLELEGLIDQMTNNGDRDRRGDVEGDEGIEDDADEKENGCKGLSLCQVMKVRNGSFQRLIFITA